MNTLALLNMYREKGVSTVRSDRIRRIEQNHPGATKIPQAELDAAMRWQR